MNERDLDQAYNHHLSKVVQEVLARSTKEIIMPVCYREVCLTQELAELEQAYARRTGQDLSRLVNNLLATFLDAENEKTDETRTAYDEARSILNNTTAMLPTVAHLAALEEHYQSEIIKICYDMDQMRQAVLKRN
ncbi:MAG: hypothetical protein D4R44_06880 [Actinobacteria bacterium]|nr:MAG: hypothetical protein D4R44_06880 [Actinomycetota bacterium]